MSHVHTLALLSIVIATFPMTAIASEKSDQKETAANRKIMADFARCVVDTQLKRATEVIVANIDNSTIQKRYNSLIDGECLGKTAGSVKLTMGGDLFRYAIADAVFQKSFVKKVSIDFTHAPKLEHVSFGDKAAFESSMSKIKDKKKRARSQYSFDQYNGVAYLSRFGECIVRLNPDASRDLLLTPVASLDEMTAITPLRPALAECLRPGSIVTFNAAMIRGVTAINYVRLAMSVPATVSESAR
jgi:hypothetical protein